MNTWWTNIEKKSIKIGLLAYLIPCLLASFLCKIDEQMMNKNWKEIDQNRAPKPSKIMVLKRFWGLNRRLDWSQGLLGEALGVILGPKAAWDNKKGPGGKICPFLGPHLETNFWIFFGFVDTSLHLVFEFPFWSLPEPIFDGFWSQNGSKNGPKFIQIQIFWKSEK